MAEFLIIALPRSRTKWLSEWLGFEGRYAIGHDLGVECSSLQDFEDSLEGVRGSVETGAVLGWRLLREWYPHLRIATISRPVDDVIRSLNAFGLGTANAGDMRARAEMLHALTMQPGVKNFTFEGLSSESECAKLWEFCLHKDFDFEWWREMAPINIQIDMAARVRALRANAPGLELLRAEIVNEISQLGAACQLN